MHRYVRIESATFDGQALPLPLSLKLSRQAEALPAAGDGDTFATSVQLAEPTVSAELRIRGVAAAEELPLGQQGNLAVVIASADGGASRTLRLTGAVLTAMEHSYEQSAMATALLRFVAEATDGAVSPFSAEADS